MKCHWSVYRQPSWTSTGLAGMAVLVEALESGGRDLLLEFEIEGRAHRCMPSHQRFRISDRRLIECVQKAMAAGWDQESRGKRFVFKLGCRLQIRPVLNLAAAGVYEDA